MMTADKRISNSKKISSSSGSGDGAPNYSGTATEREIAGPTTTNEKCKKVRKSFLTRRIIFWQSRQS